ncbi:flavin reductase family protein [Nocardioides houyundeii]|uniref:flavin reductase family protein n=1 Tax=Nocardioides houyundeii TaxID=2045452 RepID=UPI000C78F376|nr:flavin reductase family protein [Nocardioides houyundeii]
MTTTDVAVEDDLTLDPGELRRAIARIPAPVTLVTAFWEGRPVGFTASSFVNISTEPPLVGVFVGETTRSYGVFAQVERVAINVLADDQAKVAGIFAGKSDDKFTHVTLDPEHPDVPVVTEAMTTMLGRVVQRPVLGDHLMLVLQVDRLVRRLHAPLVYQDRKFRTLTDLPG